MNSTILLLRSNLEGAGCAQGGQRRIEETHFYSLVASYNYDKLHSSSHFCYPLLITPHLKRILIACVTVRALEQGSTLARSVGNWDFVKK